MWYDVSGSLSLNRRSSGVYFVRLCVPRRLQKAVGKLEIHRSTGCRDPRSARIVAADLVAEWHRAIANADLMDISAIAAGSLQLLGDGYLPLVDAALALGTTPSLLADRLIARRAPFFVHADGWLGWQIHDYEQQLEHLRDVQGLVEVVIDEHKLGGLAARTRYTGRLRIRFDEEIGAIARADAAVPVSQFLHWPSTDNGFVCDVPGPGITTAMLEVRRGDVEALRTSLAALLAPEVRAAATLGAVTKAASVPLPPMGKERTVTDLTVEYLRRHEGAWKPDQLRRRKDQCDLLVELVGDVPLAKVDRLALRELADQIARIPDERHNVRRKYKSPAATFPELIALADQHDLPRLTTQAQARLLDSLAEIFAWAVRETMMIQNPATGLGGELLKKAGGPKAKASQQRDAFSSAELDLIFSAPWFQNGVGQRTPKGKFYAYRPHYYWLPLLALFGGGRLNELSQLYLSDIRLDESGIAYFDFNLEGEGKMDLDGMEKSAGTDKSLKTINSQRMIPVHAYLLERGFMEYVNTLRDAGHVRLFPELSFDETKGYGKAAGKWFNERYLGNELRIPRDGRRTFHSLRHNFATALGAAGLQSTLKSDLMGHSRSKTLAESRYDKGASMTVLADGINGLSYPLPSIATFNAEAGLEAIQHALELKAVHGKKPRLEATI